MEEDPKCAMIVFRYSENGDMVIERRCTPACPEALQETARKGYDLIRNDIQAFLDGQSAATRAALMMQ